MFDTEPRLRRRRLYILAALTTSWMLWASTTSVKAQSCSATTALSTTTNNLHSITRGHNRKLIRSGNHFQAVWINTPGAGVRPQYATSLNGFGSWAIEGDLSLTDNGGASGMDYQLGADGTLYALESERLSPSGSRQYVRRYTVDPTTAELTAFTAPGGGPENFYLGTPPQVPGGYGSMTIDNSPTNGGRLWVAARDENNAVGAGENTILLYRSVNPVSSGDLTMSATLPVVDCALNSTYPCRIFAQAAKPKSGATRATRVITWRDPAAPNDTFLVFVAYIEGPQDQPTSAAAIWVRSHNVRTGQWTAGWQLAGSTEVVHDSGPAPDARPSSWIDDDGTLWVAYIGPSPAADNVVVKRINPPYRQVDLIDTTPAFVKIIDASGTYKPVSVQIKLDDRDCTPSCLKRAYLFTLARRTSGGANPSRLYLTKFDGTTWTSGSPTLLLDAITHRYQSQGLPALTDSSDPLATLMQTAENGCTPTPCEVRIVDASSCKFP